MKILDVSADVKPIPWRRPSQGRGGRRFTDSTLRAHREEIAWILKGGRLIGAPVAESVALSIAYRAPRGDADNLAKLLLDAGEGILWDNDSWIRELHVYLERGRPHGFRAVAEARAPNIPSDLR